MLRQRRPLFAAVLVPLAVVAIGGAAPPAIGSPPSGASTSPAVPAPAAGAPAVLPAGTTYTVTLLTGDVVTVRGTGSACPQVSVVPAGPGRVLSRSCGPDGHVRVVPADAAGLIGTTLDPNLFDVTTLIRQGYDDAHMSSLPVIVQQAPGRSAAPLATSLANRHALPSIRATAGREPKKRQPVAGFGAAAPHSAGAAPVGSGATLSAELAGASHVWLDEQVRASGLTGAWPPPATPPVTPPAATFTAAAFRAAGPMAASRKSTGPKGSPPAVAADLTQIGAPLAWQAGYTGRGQTVAILDTGIDATHPDLAGKVVASEDFTGSGDVVDRFGHGTHVAATIAGSGVASGGVHRGVAPDARLAIGKVLDDTGYGTDSGIIAGMQWAAPLASVVNLSLGGDYTDGTDPMSQAVDTLSAQYGTLFVVAAGNDGLDGEGTIQAPGAAAAALTVGAVDVTDTLADFSGRGPQTGSEAAKPDITAPGVDIISARAAGTSLGTLIDANYTADSGTSMATPHVAGAAAVLHQEHPDWSGNQLKAALMDTAAPVRGGDLYDHGAGRVDIAAASTVAVVGGATVDLGILSYPQTGTASAQVTWTNTGSRGTALALSLTVTDRQGNPTPAGVATLSATSVPVPAGGHASATVSLDEAALGSHPGLYEGVLSAGTGSTVVHTPVAFYVEPPSYDLTITTTALPGTPDGALASDALVVNLDEPSLFTDYVYNETGGAAALRVPAGDYSVIGDVWDTSASNSRDALAGASEVHVTGPTTVVLDGAHAKQVTATMAGLATQPQEVGIAVVQYSRTGLGFWTEPGAWGTDAARPAVFSTALSPVHVGVLNTYEVFGLRAPGAAPSPFLYDVARNLNGSVPADPSYVVGAGERARMARIDLTVHQLSIPDSGMGHQRYLESPDGVLVGEDFTGQMPASRMDYVTPGWPALDEGFLTGTSAVSSLLLTETGSVTYRPAGRTSIDLFGQPLHPDWYDADPTPTSGCATPAPTRTRGNMLVQLQALTDAHDRYNCMFDFWPVPASDVPTLSLSRDGHQIGSVANFGANFAVPAAAGNYRLTLDENASSLLPLSIRSSTVWTFRSTGPSGDGSAVLPLLSVDYGLPMDADDHPTGSQATFTVAQPSGVSTQHITGMSVWTSTDDGATWQPATVKRADAAQFTATLPSVASGQAVSLRVAATGSAGSGIDQTIIRAYTAA